MNEFERRSRADRLRSAEQDLMGVIDEMDARYVELWRKASTVEAREDAHRYVSLAAKFKEVFRAIAFDGAIASEVIKAQEKRKWIPGLRAG